MKDTRKDRELRYEGKIWWVVSTVPGYHIVEGESYFRILSDKGALVAHIMKDQFQHEMNAYGMEE